jgi:Delta3-Delta2-enoyl-CoA isomerase
MAFVHLSTREGIATVVLERGKVNALNEEVVDELLKSFQHLSEEETVSAVILTGTGKFFSFGFDIPEFLSYPEASFERYLISFTNLYTHLFLYPKPVVAALNGHAIAGGCMLALACDHRIVVPKGAKLSLNEMSFGSTLLAGSVEMLRILVGDRNAERVCFSAAMYSAEEALQMGLVDRIASEEGLESEAEKVARMFASRDREAFKSIKYLLRRPAAERMARREKDSIREFVQIWYSEGTRRNLKRIEIR